MKTLFPLESERLLIQPLTYHEALQYRAGTFCAPENPLTVLPAYSISPRLSEAMDNFLLPKLQAAGADYLFQTIWLIRDKQNGIIVGSFLFKGPVNAAGSVEIGYGTEPGFQGRGYMTEAIAATLKWATGWPEVRIITAETKPDNLASIQVLEKNNFEQYDQRDDLIFWRRVVTA